MLPSKITPAVVVMPLSPARVCLVVGRSLMRSRQSLNRMGLPLKMNRKTLCLLMMTPEGEDLLKAARWAERLRYPMTMPPF